MARPQSSVMEYRNYELEPDFPILVLTGDRWRISSVRGKHLHFHNCLEIGICHSSGGNMIFHKQQIRFSTGDVTCIARNVPHTTWSDEGENSLWSYIFLDAEALVGTQLSALNAENLGAGNFLSDCHLLLHPLEHPWARQLAEQIIDEMVNRLPGYQVSVRGLCSTLLVHLLRVYLAGNAETVRDASLFAIAPALDYIHANYMQDFPQEQLARLCHMSPTHFRRVFKEQIGTPPLEFLHQTRILKSCALLRSTQYTITEIAGLCGYNSQSSYNRHFIRAMGCSPRNWRKTSADTPRPSLLTFSGWSEAEEPEK